MKKKNWKSWFVLWAEDRRLKVVRLKAEGNKGTNERRTPFQPLLRPITFNL